MCFLRKNSIPATKRIILPTIAKITSTGFFVNKSGVDFSFGKGNKFDGHSFVFTRIWLYVFNTGTKEDNKAEP